MKILVLGLGNIGKRAVEDLVKSGIDEIVIGDCDRTHVMSITEKYSKNKDVYIEPHIINVNDHDNLVKLMGNVDVVANSIGPFKYYGPMVLEAAIEAGVDFIDICDDPEPTLKELELHEMAEKAGIAAVIGLGNNPGVGNLCAKYGWSKLDSVEEIKFIWIHPAFGESGDASIEHAINVFSGKAIIFRDGNWMEVQAGSDDEEIEFPKPIGKVKVVVTGHPEPITIPRYLSNVKNVYCKGALYPQWATDEFLKFLSYGLGSLEPINVEGFQVKPRKFLVAYLKKLSHTLRGGNVLKSSRVIVKGLKNGNNVTLIYDRIGLQWNAGVSLSIGSQLMGRGAIKVKGVYPPEGCLDPKLFFDELKRRGLKIMERTSVEKEI